MLGAAATLLSVVNCSDPTGPVGDEVRVDANVGSLRITNTLSEPVYTKVIGRAQLPLADWIPCVDDDRCGRIDAGSSIDVPDPNSILPPGAPMSDEAAVYWWTAVESESGERVPGPRESLLVPLSLRLWGE